MLEYGINFFKPRSDHARSSMKMIISIVSIWAVAVFGFQILLMITNRPTPEKAYLTFEKIWPEISVRPAETSKTDKQEFARTLLFILGKNLAVKKEHKDVLSQGLSWVTGELLKDDNKSRAPLAPDAAAEAIGLSTEGFDKLMREFLPDSLIPVSSGRLSRQCLAELPEIAKLYLVHNQNIFTKARFLGFPFHYWYTAQFLLILFVLLCFFYAKMTDKINKKHGLEGME